MEFNKENEIQRYIDMWNSRKHSGMKHAGADWDKRSFGWVKELKEDAVRAARSKRRVEETAKYLRSRGLLGPDQSVIDIGCGPGQFVAEFAKTSGRVIGTDISPQMCKFGKEHSESLGLFNTDFVPCDFKEADIDELGWRGAFDLVFSSITPALSAYDAFRKSEQMSRGWCFQSNFIKITDEVSDKVLAAVLPEDMMPVERSVMSFSCIFNILLLEGKKPETMYFYEEEEERNIVDDNYIERILKMAPKVPRTKEMFDMIRKEFMKYADSEGYVSTHREWHYGWLLWHV